MEEVGAQDCRKMRKIRLQYLRRLCLASVAAVRELGVGQQEQQELEQQQGQQGQAEETGGRRVVAACSSSRIDRSSGSTCSRLALCNN